jgi:hypothetical protein
MIGEPLLPDGGGVIGVHRVAVEIVVGAELSVRAGRILDVGRLSRSARVTGMCNFAAMHIWPAA